MGLGNVFGGSFGSFLGSALPVLGTAVGTLFGAPQIGALAGGGIAGALTGFDQPGPVAVGPTPTGFVTPPGGVPIPQFANGDAIEAFTGVPSFLPQPAMVAPAAAGAAVPVIMGLTRSLALTISKLAGRLGIAVLGVTGLSRVGARIWRSLVAFTRRHPNISALSLLTSLGLTIEEASEFIAWGTTRRRRRRGGISTRDMRIARRTIRRIRSFEADLGGMRRARRGLRVPPGTSIVRAG